MYSRSFTKYQPVSSKVKINKDITSCNDIDIECIRSKEPIKKIEFVESIPINILETLVNKKIGEYSMNPVIFFQHAIHRITDDFNTCARALPKNASYEDLKKINSRAYNVFAAFIYSHGFVQCYSYKTDENEKPQGDGLQLMFDLYAYTKKLTLDHYIFFKTYDIKQEQLLPMIDLDCDSVRYVDKNNEYVVKKKDFLHELELLVPASVSTFAVLPIHYRFTNNSAHFLCYVFDSRGDFVLVDVNPTWVENFYVHKGEKIINKVEKFNKYKYRGNLIALMDPREGQNFHEKFYSPSITFGVCEILTRVIVKDMLAYDSIQDYIDKSKENVRTLEWKQKMCKNMLMLYKNLFKDKYTSYFQTFMQDSLRKTAPQCKKCIDNLCAFYFPLFPMYDVKHFQQHQRVWQFCQKKNLADYFKKVYLRIMYPYIEIMFLPGDKTVHVPDTRQKHHLFALHHYILASKYEGEMLTEDPPLNFENSTTSANAQIARLVLYQEEYLKLRDEHPSIYTKWLLCYKHALQESEKENKSFLDCIYDLYSQIKEEEITLW